MKTRAWQLAKELGISSKDLVDVAAKHKIDIKNHLSALDQNQVDKLLSIYKKGSKPNKKVAKEKVSKRPETNASPSQRKVSANDNAAAVNPKRTITINKEKPRENLPKGRGRENQKPELQSRGKTFTPERNKDNKNKTYIPQRNRENRSKTFTPEGNRDNRGKTFTPEGAKENRSKTFTIEETGTKENRKARTSIAAANKETRKARPLEKAGREELKKERTRGEVKTAPVAVKKNPRTTSSYKKKPRSDSQDNQRHHHHHRNNKRFGRTKNYVSKARPTIARVGPIDVTVPISLKKLSQTLGINSSKIIKNLFENYSISATLNQLLNEEYVEALGVEFGKDIRIKQEEDQEESLMKQLQKKKDSPEDLVPRAPVVTFLGHVDHGKTSLLDYIRSSKVASGEAGGITQRIGAYKVKTKNSSIVFLDTPGHEAFTSMRARGANVTDIAVLVVAADDGVMPQTIEAINHAKAAEVPIIVALNKIDKPGANPEVAEQQLSRHGLVPEKWQGDTPFVEVSAITGQGVNELLEYISLVAEMQELRANPTKKALGTLLEASVQEGKGTVATILVQDGTLKRGDNILCGNSSGKVRDIINDKGKKLKEAGPSTPVSISGLSDLPSAGDKFYVVDNLSQAKSIAEDRQKTSRESTLHNGVRRPSFEQLMQNLQEGTAKQLCLIVKADGQGSVEAISQKIEQYSHEEVELRVLHAAVGGINERDVQLAIASKALILAFNVVASKPARDLADDKGVEIKRYSVIYHLFEELKDIMSGMLPPERREKTIGHAEIRKIIRISKIGNIAGCYVTDGYLERNSKIRISRQGVTLNKGKAMDLSSLRRFKEDTAKVKEGFECGVRLIDFDDLREGDEIEAFKIIEVARKID